MSDDPLAQHCKAELLRELDRLRGAEGFDWFEVLREAARSTGAIKKLSVHDLRTMCIAIRGVFDDPHAAKMNMIEAAAKHRIAQRQLKK